MGTTNTTSENIIVGKVNVINVVENGMDNTGTTDCTTLFNTLTTSCVENGYSLYFPKGTYKFNDIVDIKSSIYSDGATFIANTVTNSREHFFKATTLNGAVIENITFQCNVSDRILVGLFNSSDTVFRNCTFTVINNVTCLSEFDLYTSNKNIIFENCTFECVTGAELGGVWVREFNSASVTKNISFMNCIFNHATVDEIVAVWGWRGTVENIRFDNCHFEQCEGANNSTHMFTLGMSGITRNILFTNCRIDNNYTKSSIIHAMLSSENAITENVKFENCDFNITNFIDSTIQFRVFVGAENDENNWHNLTFDNCNFNINYPFTKNRYMFGYATLLNCYINVTRAVLFTDCIVDGCKVNIGAGIVTHSRKALIRNSEFTCDNVSFFAQYMNTPSEPFYCKLHNIKVKHNTVPQYNIINQTTNNNLQIVIDGCEFDGSFYKVALIHDSIINAESVGSVTKMYNNYINGVFVE